jgi:thiol-disulfide isomerase/thioredoxin
MKIHSTMFALMVMSSACMHADNLSVKIDLSDNPLCGEMNVNMRPVEDYSAAASVTLQKADASLRVGEIVESPSGLYYLYCYTPKYQTSIPVSLDVESVKSPIKVSVKDYVVTTSLSGPVNNALVDANTRFTDRARTVGNGAADMTSDELRTALAGFISDGEAVIADEPSLPASTQEFIRLWAYTLASDSYSMALHVRGRAGKEVSFNASDILPAPASVLDTPMAAGFPSVTGAVASTLPGKNVEEKLAALHELYNTQTIKDNVTSMLVRGFMSGFDYKNDFESGVTRLQALTDKYSLPASYLESFRARRATVPGLPFPEGVKLLDRDGKVVDFSTFRGKYVYVDLWASWCGPCCKEVPYLQQLEKDMEGSNVVFVSISCDSSTAPWFKKMEQLGMHGNQLIDTTNELGNKLNVRGIPHFLIYDPEGNLHTYNAPRPSSSQILPLLRSLK